MVDLLGARGLLADPGLTLTDIAFCTRSSDQAHFSRTFRKYIHPIARSSSPAVPKEPRHG